MIPFLYALVTSVATLTGGALPMYTRLRLVEQRYMVAFAGGAMVAIALFDLIPEMQSHNAIALLAGFFIVYLLEKLVMLHSCGETECESHTIGWSALIGIAAESLIDGIAIAVGYRAAPALGLLIALAVFIHEVPRGLTTTVIMQEAGYSRLKIWGRWPWMPASRRWGFCWPVSSHPQAWNGYSASRQAFFSMWARATCCRTRIAASTCAWCYPLWPAAD